MNRFYNPSAPRYTSQFVEEQYPFDLMLAHLQQKQSQQAAFAESIGTLQGMAATIPNGFRTEDMAPKVRDRWDNNITQWSSQNMNNYDSPQAIAELSKMHAMFQRDPSVQLMKKDADESKYYMQERMKAGPSDVDPNILDRNSGKLFQFQEGDAYVPYSNIITDPDVETKLHNIFSKIEAKETTVPYMQEVDYNGQKIMTTGHRSVKKTDMNQYNQTFENTVKEALAGDNEWSSYMKAMWRQNYGRDLTEEDARAFIKPIAERTIKSDYADQRSYHMPSGGSDNENENNKSQWGDFNLQMADKPSEYRDWTRKLNRQFTLATSDPNFKIENHPEMYNIHKQFENNPAYRDLKTWREKSNYIKKNYTVPENKTQYNLATEPFSAEQKKDLRALFFDQLSSSDKINATTASSYFVGMPIYNYNTNELLQDVDKKQIVNEDSKVEFLGRTSASTIGKAVKPGLVHISVTNGNKKNEYLIQFPKFVEEERPSHDLLSMDRTISGIGDASVWYFGGADQNNLYNPQIMDVDNTKMDDKELKVEAPNGLFIQPVKDNSDKGMRKVKVYRDNFYKYYGDRGQTNFGELLLDNNKNELFLKEYNVDEYPSIKELYDQIVKDSNPFVENSLLNQ